MRPLLIIAVSSIIATAEPIFDTSPDLIKYAITQGGLLAVVLILLWSYRKDTLGSLAMTQQTSEERRAHADALVALVRDNTIALTKTADVLQSLARTVERIEERKALR